MVSTPREPQTGNTLELAIDLQTQREAEKAIKWGSETDLETGMALAIEAYNVTVTTDDRWEGVRAFNEKRKPNFKGK